MSLSTDIFDLVEPTTLVIASDVVTVTQTAHKLQSETGSADDLATITVGTIGFTPKALLLLIQPVTGHTITVKHGTGNIQLSTGADMVLGAGDILALLWVQSATTWYDISGARRWSSPPTYGAPTGTATRTTFDTATVTLAQLAERVKAMIDDHRNEGDFA